MTLKLKGRPPFQLYFQSGELAYTALAIIQTVPTVARVLMPDPSNAALTLGPYPAIGSIDGRTWSFHGRFPDLPSGAQAITTLKQFMELALENQAIPKIFGNTPVISDTGVQVGCTFFTWRQVDDILARKARRAGIYRITYRNPHIEVGDPSTTVSWDIIRAIRAMKPGEAEKPKTIRKPAKKKPAPKRITKKKKPAPKLAKKKATRKINPQVTNRKKPKT